MKQAPKNLSQESHKFWNEILKIYELQPHHEKILEAACRCWDRVLEARLTVEKEDAYFKDRFGQVKSHPALEVETKNKNLFMRLVRELGFDLKAPDTDSRPPRQY